MAEQESVYLFSTTALTNGSSDPAINFAENQLPSTVNNSARALMAAVARFLKDNNGSLTTGGSANAQTLTINGRQTAYASGHLIAFKAGFTNTGATTLTVTNGDAASLGAKALRTFTIAGDSALVANQIIANGHYVAQYDPAANSAAGAWVVLNPTPNVLSSPVIPGGRLTLTTGVPVTASDVTAATTLYYSAVGGGQYIPVWDGAGWRGIDISTDLSLALDSNSGHTGYQQSGKNFDVWGAYVSGTTYFGTGPTWNAGAGAGSDTARGTGAASTELLAVNGVLTNKNSMTLRFGSSSGNTVTVPVSQATLLGSIRMTADGQTEDSFVKRFVSNAYNSRIRPMLRIDTTDTWNYSVAAFQQANASAANQVEWLHCLAGVPVQLHVLGMAITNNVSAVNITVGVGIDSTSVSSSLSPTGRCFFAQPSSAGARAAEAWYDHFPGIGYHKGVWLEYGSAAVTVTWNGDAGNSFTQTGISGRTEN